jgi:hypothetical protein
VYREQQACRPVQFRGQQLQVVALVVERLELSALRVESRCLVPSPSV